MEPLLFGIDLATPLAVVAGFDSGRVLLLSRHAAHAPSLDAHAWDWSPGARPALEAEATRVLEAARARYANPPDAPCEAALCVPSFVGPDALAALQRAAASARFTVRRTMRPAEALGRAEDAHEGMLLVVSADLGHLEVGVFEATEHGPVERAYRGVAAPFGSLFVDNLVSWLTFTLDARRTSALSGVREALADTVRHALATTPPGKSLHLVTPYLGVGHASVTVPAEVLAFAFDSLVDRVASLIDEATKHARVKVTPAWRFVIAGRQWGVGALAERLSQQLGARCIVRDASTTARETALEAAHARQESQRAPSAPPSWIPPSEPPAVIPPPAPSVAPPAMSAPASVAPPAMSAPASVAPPASPSTYPADFDRPSVLPASMPPSSSIPIGARLMSGEVVSARLPREGAFSVPHGARSLYDLPLVRAATAEEAATRMPLAAVLSQIGMRPHLHGSLILKGDGESVHLGIEGGAPLLHGGDRSRFMRAFSWSDGRYALDEHPLDDALNATRETMTGLVFAGLRLYARELTDAQVIEALGEKMHLAPTVRLECGARLHRTRLLPQEDRTVKRAFDPVTDLATHVGRASSMLRLTYLLDLLGILAWAPPAKSAHDDRREELERRVSRLNAQNHFECLFVHWTANSEEVVTAWRKFRDEYGPTGPWHAVDAGLARAAYHRGEAAWAVLEKEPSRLRYRVEAYPTINQEMLIPLVEGRAKTLAYAGQIEEAEDMLRLLRELHGLKFTK